MTPDLEIEGTWEEILKRAPELRGRRLRVSVIDDSHASSLRLTKRETRLLERINEPRPEGFNSRYRDLIAQQKQGSLTSEEQIELFRKVDEAEVSDAERLENLIDLAELWGKPLDQLMDHLGLRGLQIA